MGNATRSLGLSLLKIYCIFSIIEGDNLEALVGNGDIMVTE